MPYSVVGRSVPRIDGVVKARGEAQYVVDMVLPRMLVGKALRSPHPHARVLHIDTSRAERLPGVRGVITGRDTLGIKFGTWRGVPEPVYWDQHVLARDKVRYVGDEVAAVAAIDEDTAEEALDLIRVEYEELPAVFEAQEAMKEGAPQLHDHVQHNTSAVRRLELGDVERGFKESDYVREDNFSTQLMAHAPLEPHACLASFDLPGKLTLWTSTQNPHVVQSILATVLGMHKGDVRVIKPYVGGGFGGKLDLFPHEACAALLSQKTGKPVKIVLTREEVFAATRRRHSIDIHVKTGVKKDGTLVAREFRSILDGGAYNTLGPIVTILHGLYASRSYRVANFRYTGFRVYTNKTPCGALRGFGGPQSTFASECQLDMIAEDLGLDPVELRLKNAVQVGDTLICGSKVLSCGLSQCLEEAAQSTAFRTKRGRLGMGRGIGLAAYNFSSGSYLGAYPAELPYSEAMVRVNDDGTAHLFTGASDIGQGSDTVMCQIAAEELGMKLENIWLTAADTQTSGMDVGTFSSRVTVFGGNAVRAACADARRQLFEAATQKLGLKPGQELEAREGRIYVRGSPDIDLSLAEAALACQGAHNGRPVVGRGSYGFQDKKTEHGAPSSSFGAQIAEVEVDRETGLVKVLWVTTAHDCGKAINPQSVEGQLDGSVHMGLGYALTEEVLLDKGKTLNPCFADYKILRSLDMPQVKSIVVETDDPTGPFGAKEAGEGLTLPTAPAIANAIYDAVGVRINSLPITPEKILQALARVAKA